MLLACALAGVAWLGGQAEFTIRVLDAAGAPVGQADVTFLEDADATSLWRMYRPVTEAGAWDDARARLGARMITDVRGEVVVDRPSGGFSVTASAAGAWAGRWVLDEAATTVELTLDRDRAFSVRVVGEHGEPRPSVAVALFNRSTNERVSPSAFVVVQWLAIVESDEHGVAHFAHAQRWLTEQPGMRLVVALGIPLTQPVELALDPAKLGDGEQLELTLPATGSVEIAAPGVLGVSRLRAAPPVDSSAARVWSNYAPLRVLVDAGLARFSHVGLGAELELEVTWDGLVQPVRRRFAGPTRAGETVRHVLPGQDTQPVLVGRLLDQELRALASRHVTYTLVIGTTNGSSSRGGSFATDELGRFRVSLSSEPLAAGQYRELLFHTAPDAKAVVDLTRALEPGEHDLGDIAFVPAGSDALLRRMSDDELLAEHDQIRVRLQRNGSYERELETCLTEMVRRGGKRWIDFLQRELDALHERVVTDTWIVNEPDELVWLTALRRAQGQLDPLSVTIDGPALYESTYPALPVLNLRLINVDSTDGYLIARPPLAGRFHVEIRSSDGAQVAPLEPSIVEGGMSSIEELVPGESLPLTLRMGTYVALPEPGEYTLRVLFHPSDAIAFVRDTRGWILSTSAPIVLRATTPTK